MHNNVEDETPPCVEILLRFIQCSPSTECIMWRLKPRCSTRYKQDSILSFTHPFQTTDESLRAAFEVYGTILSASLVLEPVTQKSRYN
jgi:hypothetical protein